MAIDLYSSCPCGSGKKFKWCCQPIQEQIDKAYQQNTDGQHEAALRIMNQVTQEHADNPQAWGQLAQLLFSNEQAEEAETALEKALTLDKDYAFGYMLKGHFRLYEGEIAGALMLFRRATELYDPETKTILAQLYFNIFDCEMRLNHPVAAHVAAEKALHLNPANEELRSGLATVFGPENSNLPQAAKKEYRYQTAAASAGSERRAAWDKALAQTKGRLKDAVQAFQALTGEDENDAAAWYNLGLSHAWNGNNLAAVDALDRYVGLEEDDVKAEEAWALAETLLCGQGTEDRANFVEHSVVVPLANPEKFVTYLGELEQQGLLFGARVDEENGILSALLLEKPGPALTAEQEAQQAPRFSAHLVFMGNVLRIWSTNKERLEKQFRSMESQIGPSVSQASWVRGPVKFQDVLVEFFIFPRVLSGDQAGAGALLAKHIEREFEEGWIHRPAKSLGNVSPTEAAGKGKAGKKLRGLLRFIEDCGAMLKLPYDFNRLRQKLGLGGEAAPQKAVGVDVSAMNVAELAGVDVKTLEPGQLEQAFQAAMKLDAREVAGQFAHEIVARPASAERPDRYFWHNHLVQLALARGDTGAALEHVNDGEKDDCEGNEGRRRNDYELRRGQVHAKAGQFAEAQDVFDRLIARSPDDLKYRAAAAESMISGKQGQRAKTYLSAGLDLAKKQQNRDLEGHFQELLGAAERMA